MPKWKAIFFQSGQVFLQFWIFEAIFRLARKIFGSLKTPFVPFIVLKTMIDLSQPGWTPAQSQLVATPVVYNITKDSLPGVIHGLSSVSPSCWHFLKRRKEGNSCTFEQWWKMERIFSLAKAALPNYNDFFFTLLLFQGLPIEELMAHQIIFVMDLCHNFKFGQDTREKDLKRRLLIPFTKCLMERKMLSVKFSYAFNYQQAQPQPKLRLQHPPNQHAPGRNGRVFCWGQPKMILNVM